MLPPASECVRITGCIVVIDMGEAVQVVDAMFRERLVNPQGYTSDFKLNKPPFPERYGFTDPCRRSPIAHAAVFFCGPQNQDITTALPFKMQPCVYTSGKVQAAYRMGHKRLVDEMNEFTESYGLRVDEYNVIFGYVRPI